MFTRGYRAAGFLTALVNKSFALFTLNQKVMNANPGPDPVRPHGQVSCPRCQHLFECRVGSINLCSCQTVVLSEAQRQYIDEQFTGCLCTNCLLALRTAYNRLNDDRAIS